MGVIREVMEFPAELELTRDLNRETLYASSNPRGRAQAASDVAWIGTPRPRRHRGVEHCIEAALPVRDSRSPVMFTFWPSPPPTRPACPTIACRFCWERPWRKNWHRQSPSVERENDHRIRYELGGTRETVSAIDAQSVCLVEACFTDCQVLTFW